MNFDTVYAAEFDNKAPSTKYTPIPQALVEHKYKMEVKKKKEDTEKMDKVTQENNAALRVWDSYLNSDNNGKKIVEEGVEADGALWFPGGVLV